jgi:hypothetical protein
MIPSSPRVLGSFNNSSLHTAALVMLSVWGRRAAAEVALFEPDRSLVQSPHSKVWERKGGADRDGRPLAKPCHPTVCVLKKG